MILQISKTYAKYLQALEDSTHFTPPDARVFMVMVKKDMSTKAEPFSPERLPPSQLKHIEEMVSLDASLQPSEGTLENLAITKVSAIHCMKDKEEPQGEEVNENEVDKGMDTTGNIHTDHISPRSPISHYTQQVDNCSEEALSLATDMGNNDNYALDYHHGPCNTNIVQEPLGNENEASTLEENDCDEELMQLEDMELIDMWYQVDHCSEVVKSFKRIK